MATILDEQGNLLIDGLEAHVVPPSPADEALLARIPFDESALGAALGTRHFLDGLRGPDLLRHYLLAPFGCICAVTAGDPEAGLMLAGKASARLDLRLVPNLQPALVADLLQAHLRRRGFDQIQVSLLAGVAPDRCPVDAPIVDIAVAAAREYSRQEPVVYPSMAAISASHVFHHALGTPVIFAGAVTDDASHLHGPDENIRVADYMGYMKFFGRLLHRFEDASGAAIMSRGDGV